MARFVRHRTNTAREFVPPTVVPLSRPGRTAKLHQCSYAWNNSIDYLTTDESGVFYPVSIKENVNIVSGREPQCNCDYEPWEKPRYQEPQCNIYPVAIDFLIRIHGFPRYTIRSKITTDYLASQDGHSGTELRITNNISRII